MRRIGFDGLVVTLVAATATTFVAIEPGVADAGAARGVRPGPMETVCVDIPAELATAGDDVVLANVTVTEPIRAGYVTAHDESANPAAVSTLNFPAGATVPNLAAVRLTDSGRLCVTPNWTSATHVVLDVVGVLDGAAFTAAGDVATRVLDTRLAGSPTGGRRLAAGGEVCAALPAASDGSVAVINTTVTAPEAAGHLTVHAKRTSAVTSSLNYAAGQTVANLTFTPVVDGQVCATASGHAATHVLLDWVGTLRADVFARPAGGAQRILDTRASGGATVAPASTVCVHVPGARTGAVAIVNAAIAAPTATGFATIHAPDAPPSATSTHNFTAGQTVANLTATVLDTRGEVCATPSKWSAAHVVLDWTGTLAPEAFRAAPGGAVRVLDTRTASNLPGRWGQAELDFAADCAELHDRWVDRQLAEVEQLYGTDLGAIALPPVALPATGGDAPAAAADFSTTNTQVDGIDEGDIVETDGRYVFTATGPNVVVVDSATATVVAELPLVAGSSPQLILWGNRLLVATHSYQVGGTAVQVFDVADPAHPVERSRELLAGYPQAMRSIDGRVRLVLSANTAVPRRWQQLETVGELRQRIIDAPQGSWLPQRRALDASGNPTGIGAPTLACDRIADPGIGPKGSQLTYIAEIGLADDSPIDGAAGVLTREGAVTVSASARQLFVAVAAWPGILDWWSATTVTQLYAFELAGDSPARYVAAAELPGQVLNQFAIGEHDGVVRIALTNGWGVASASAVYALRRTGNTFERLSIVPDLGIGEHIRAVRHIGPLSYVVTFRQVDPLYITDFGDPERPVLLGELKIPGFSTYLHPLGEGRLAGVGFDATDAGQITGAQLSLFDVATPSDPRRVDTFELGDDTEASWDHHAFLWWPAASTIAVPSHDTGGPTLTVVRAWGDELVAGGFVRPDGCDAFRRSIVIGDELIGIGSRGLTIANLLTLDVRARVTWHDAPSACQYPAI